MFNYEQQDKYPTWCLVNTEMPLEILNHSWTWNHKNM